MQRLNFFLLLGLLIAGCNPSPPAQHNAPPFPSATPATPAPKAVEITVSVAASAKDLIQALADEFKAQDGVTVHINAGPSSGLANQILAGSPAQLFLSANQQWADAVSKGGQSLESKRLLTNKLVIVVPEGNPAKIQQPSDLLSDAVTRIALAGEKVPAGQYADQALTKLDLLSKLTSANKIARGQDVRTALSFVERGEAEAGIVYSTDVAATPSVEAIYEFPSDLHDEIVYVLVLLKDAEGNAAAKTFYNFLASSQAALQYRKFGFIPWEEKKALVPRSSE